MCHPNQITDATHAVEFMLAGNSRTTLVSGKTGTRYTYRIQAAKESGDAFGLSGVQRYFVSLLTGQDNEADYTYMGVIEGDTPAFRLTKKSTYKLESAPVQAISFAFKLLGTGRIHPDLQIWHEGRCGRCNRVLTDPVSIARGLGPECARH